MHLKPTLVLLLVFVWCSLLSQVTVLGKFAIGDPTNVQLLQTHRGDHFRGWVSAWTADSIVFQTNNSYPIAFPNAAVKSIEVGDSELVGDLATDFFVMRTTDGGTYYGYPTKITKKYIAFDASKAGYMRLRPRDVLSMEPITAALVSREAYVNEYAVNLKNDVIPDGRLLAFKDGKIEHIAADGEVYKTSTEAVIKYKLIGQPLSYSGHGRSLMFAQTGFGMKPKEKEYRNIMVGINIFSFGLTEKLSIGIGLISLLPYADIKFSQSFGKYVHLSAGVYGLLPFSAGFHGALSLGTPDYFLNIGVNKNYESRNFYSYFAFENFNVGASLRAGRRSRFFAEYHIMTSKTDDDFNGGTFYGTGFVNAFSWGYGWYNKKFRFETGIMQTGPYQSWRCSSFFSGNTNPCNDYYHVPVPFIAMAINFRR